VAAKKKGTATLEIVVENSGPFHGPRAGSHGVPTVERRLALAYDGAASLDLHGSDGRTIATLELPTTGPRIST
jgi:hypothetical protein